MSSMSKASGTKVIFMPYSANDGGAPGTTFGTSSSYGGDGSSNKKIDPVKAAVYEQIAEQH